MNQLSEFKYSEEANEKAKQDIQEYCQMYDDSVILADGFELAFLGFGYSFVGTYAIYNIVICKIDIYIEQINTRIDKNKQYL